MVLRNVFHPSEFEAEPALHSELQADMLKECAKLGAVDKARAHALPGAPHVASIFSVWLIGMWPWVA